jgi:hypothetical protein
MAGKKKGNITVKCRYSTVSIGATKVTIPVSVDDGDVDIDALRAAVVGNRLDVLLTYDPLAGADEDGQGTILDTKESIKNVADCPSISIGPKAVSFRLSFARDSVDIATLVRVVQSKGEITLQAVGGIPPAKRGRPRKDDNE